MSPIFPKQQPVALVELVWSMKAALLIIIKSACFIFKAYFKFICNWIQILERTCEVHFHYALYFYDVLSRGVLATEDANLARFAAYKST